ncbi:MAG: RidA family protein [Halobacteria archaeon]|nr:RidA family protein [Halobacteria archaeon]
MTKEIISTSDAPEAVGAYSQATKANGFVFTAGQIPLTPDGELVEGTVEKQTRQCLENIRAVLEEAGTSMENVVKVTVFLDDIDDFGEMNSTYETFFDENPPARSAVEAGNIPKGVAVEIEAVAVAD